MDDRIIHNYYIISTKMVQRLKYNIMLINDGDSEGHSTAVGQH